MVTLTRTQTGTINALKYDNISLQIKGEHVDLPEHISKKLKLRGRLRGKTSSVKDRAIRKSREKKVVRQSNSTIDKSLTNPRMLSNSSGGTVDSNFFWPKVVFGEEPRKGLSKIGRADLQVRRWKDILKAHEENYPEAAPACQLALTRVRNYRNTLNANPDNKIVVNVSKREQVVQDRIQLLKNTLATARFRPEKENIQGAIIAYESGAIVYSKQYTLIWGGKVVDQADSYAEFTVDRPQRLDRYSEKYGPHWLWWENPLWLEPSQRLKAGGCQIVDRTPCSSGFGQFYINQGFCKQFDMVARMRPVSALRSTLSQPGTLMANQECHEPGPKLIFRSLLDSGASFPSLYRSDFEALGISPQQYAAQSVAHVLTANGEAERRIYELHVEIAGNDGTPIIDPESPVLPDFPRYIGGLSPVFYEDAEPLTNENGYEANGRLSGVMPFLAPYVSMTPAKNMILMGENRNDVLGSHKMPTQRRWQIDFDQTPASRENWSNYQDPLITFSHRDGRFVDQDLAPAVTRVSLNIGLPNESFHVFDARGDYMMDSYIQDPDAALNQEGAP